MRNIKDFPGWFLFVFLYLFSSHLKAQNISQELSGRIMFYDKCNDSEFPLANAFDNDINTYFRSCPPFGNWIGMDLGEKHTITKVAYCPRVDSDYRDRLQLGVFEGANSEDFGDAIPLFIIPGYTTRELTEREIECTRGFRYVRFVFPYAQIDGKSSYMGELKFYGYKGEGDDSKLPQLTNLPTVSIHTVDAQDITSKENYVKGIISVIYADGTKIHTDSVEIRGRGNNSWSHPKKPYRIKLATSTRLMDLPAKARNWTLINNYGDKTLMRNMLAFDFSRRLEMPYTSPAEAVDVVLNGDYKGCYQLCDHIDVRKNRVDIEEMGPEDLSGGYMIEIDAYAYPDEPKRFTSHQYGIPVTIKYPKSDEIVRAQEVYIEEHFNKLVNAISTPSYKNPQRGFRRYLDEETFLRHFLVGEYAGNTDTYWSVRMTKLKDDDKFYVGPCWDFDLGFENDRRTYPVNQNAWQSDQWVCFSEGSSAAGGARDMVERILSDEDMVSRMEEIYAYYRDNNVVSKEILDAVVDSCAEMIYSSQELNFKRWQIMNTQVHENPVIYGSYRGEVKNVKDYIAGRIDWMDHKLNFIPGSSVNLDSQEGKNSPEIYIFAEKNRIIIEGLIPEYTLKVVDMYGNICWEGNTQANSISVNVNSGIYLIILTGINQQFVYKCMVE